MGNKKKVLNFILNISQHKNLSQTVKHYKSTNRNFVILQKEVDPLHLLKQVF